MSEQAKKHFALEQRHRLENVGKILSVPIPVIEEVGGGGIRCMLAELF